MHDARLHHQHSSTNTSTWSLCQAWGQRCVHDCRLHEQRTRTWSVRQAWRQQGMHDARLHHQRKGTRSLLQAWKQRDAHRARLLTMVVRALVRCLAAACSALQQQQPALALRRAEVTHNWLRRGISEAHFLVWIWMATDGRSVLWEY